MRNEPNTLSFDSFGFRLRKTYRANVKVIVAFILAIILFLLGAALCSGFASLSHVMMILKVSAFLGILTLAQTVVLLAGGEGIDLSVGAIASVGAVAASVIINGNNAMIPLALVVILIIGFILGLLNGLGISLLGIPPLVMTLAMSNVISGGLIIYSNGLALRGTSSPLLNTLASQSTFGIPNMLFIWLVVIVIAVLALQKTKFGIILLGVGSSDLTAELNGIHAKRVRCLAYAFSGAISALAGVCLLGYIGSPYIDIGTQYVLPSVAAAVIGGVSLAGGEGNYIGTVGGAIVLTTLTAILTTLKMGDGGKQVVFGLVLVIMLALYGRQVKSAE
jgi:ribose transport system permease protein